MATRSNIQPEVEAAVGIATSGHVGLAYVALRSGDRERTVRVPFSATPAPGLQGRDLTYGALAAVANRLLEDGIRRVNFTIADERLPADLEERRGLPAALTLAYVGLRCRLNRFAQVRVAAADTASLRDLTARARAEVSLNVAA